MKSNFIIINIVTAILMLCRFSMPDVIAQDESESQFQTTKDRYIYGDVNKLQIVVHIWGAVNRPGQYVVPDGTSVLELISMAGGPTEFSDLGNVLLTREKSSHSSEGRAKNKQRPSFVKKELVRINLKKYLENEKSDPLPILEPGNVVKINKNYWYKWQTLIRVVSQVAIVIQAVYFYTRIED